MKRYALVAAVLVSAALLAYLRISGEKGQPFQAAAHLELGALLLASVSGRAPGAWWVEFWKWARFPALVALALSVIEVAMFFVTREGR